MTRYYRYEYTHGEPYSLARIELRSFPLIKKTPRGAWIGYLPHKKFVLDNSRKQWACPTIEAAFTSLQARLYRRHNILRTDLELVEIVMTACSEEKDKLLAGRAVIYKHSGTLWDL